MKFKATTFIVTIGLLLFNASCVSKNNSSSDINISSSSDLIYTTSTLESSIEFNTSISSPQIISSSSSTSKPTSREKISIYLNPSVQTKNMYINNLGSEAENMSYIDIEANIAKNGLSLSQSVNQSNSRKRHIHFALHSNAGGGQGTEIYTKGSNKTFATTMYESFLELGNFKRRGVKDGTHLYEIKNVKADHVALIEFAFHDNLKEAKFIVENKALIANQMAKSILKYIDTYY